MAQSTEPICHLDKLPDELLHEVLIYVLASDYPFYLERHPDTAENVEKEMRPFGPRPAPLTIHYPHSNKTSVFRGAMLPPQFAHIADWLFINTTSRRIRRIGKILFFRVKSIAMTNRLPALLVEGTGKRIVSREDQQLAATCMRDVVFVNNHAYSPADLLGLPKRVAPFPKLERCTLLIGYRPGSEPLEWLFDAFKSLGDTPDSFKMPKMLRHLLVGTGVPEGLDMRMVLCRGTTWEYWRNQLETSVYSVLRFRVQLLEKMKAGSEIAGD